MKTSVCLKRKKSFYLTFSFLGNIKSLKIISASKLQTQIDIVMDLPGDKFIVDTIHVTRRCNDGTQIVMTELDAEIHLK